MSPREQKGKSVRVRTRSETIRMPHRPRVHLDWVTLHIVQQGHNRRPCIFDDQDRHAYLAGCTRPCGESAAACTPTCR